MMDEATGAHIDSQALLAYCRWEATEEEERLVEQHLAECDECARTARDLELLAEVPRHWRDWHLDEAYARLQAARTGDDPEIEPASSKPASTSGPESRSGLRVILKGLEEGARIARRGLAELAALGPGWTIEAGGLRAVAEGPGGRRVRVELLAPGSPAPVRGRRRETEGSTPSSEVPDGRTRAERGYSIRVTLEGYETENRPGVAAVWSPEGEELVAPYTRRGKSRQWVARIEDLSSGEYVLQDPRPQHHPEEEDDST